MAIRVENIHSKVLGQDSTCSMPHLVSSPWWNLQEQQLSQTSSKNLSLRVETPSLCFEEAKHLGQQIEEDQSSHSMESSSQSQRGATTMGKSNSQDQCISSESGPPWLIKAIQIDPVQNESFGKHVEEQPKPAFFPSNLESSANPSQIEFLQSAAQIPCIYSDPYFSSLYSAYGPQAMIQPQMMGIAPARVPLPPDLAQDGPIYVNAKQYHGILRRRQVRAKLEAQNKMVKGRKPYLHESRHQHAMNRVRGSGGRFLSTKKQQQQSESTLSTGSFSASIHSCQETDALEMEAERSNDSRHYASTSTSSSAMGYTPDDIIFQQHADSYISLSGQIAGSTSSGGFMQNGTPLHVPTTR
nr:nuclear transcription factor Y subunit A-3-like isoform X2 [Coffea arabica]